MALVITVAMVLGLMSMTAFADQTQPDGSITVKSPVLSASYAAYKIFDMTSNADNTSFSYTISSDNPFYAAVVAYANAADEDDADGLTLTKVGDSANPEVYNISATDDFDAQDFGVAMRTAIEGTPAVPAVPDDPDTPEDESHEEIPAVPGISVTPIYPDDIDNNPVDIAHSDEIKFSELELGYYLINATYPSASATVNIPGTDPAVSFTNEDTEEAIDAKIENYVNSTVTSQYVKDYVDANELYRTLDDGSKERITSANITNAEMEDLTEQLKETLTADTKAKVTAALANAMEGNESDINVKEPILVFVDSTTPDAVINEKNEIPNDAYPSMSSDADLVYTAVRIQHQGYLHHIWTQRVPTADEKTRLVELVNSDLSSQNLPADATVDNVRWVSGLPIDHEFVYSPSSQLGYKIAFTWDDRTPPQPNTIHVDVRNHGAFSNICYGTLQYNYTAGSTNFRNELQPVSYNVEKTWGDEVDPPVGAVINVGLKGTVTRKVEPQPEGATETVYETVQVDLPAAGVTQKIQVTLNGGAEGGDDTAANPWKYTWSGLPPCDKAGNEITYSVQELSYTIGGHTVNLRDFTPSEDTASTPGTTKLTNQIPAFSFDILKIDARTATPLEGAQFTIQAIEATSPVTTPVIVQGTTPSPSTPETTGESGKVTFSDIPLGYYELEEAYIPDGYIILDNRKFYIRVDTDDVKLLEKVITDGHLSFREVTPGAGGRIILGNIELTKSGKTITFTVENTSGSELPYTGGPGTKLFTILGAMLLVLAAAGMAVMKTGLIKRRF